ncbi:MAG TPA: polyprenyl synthetase family protein [Pyrinomonadaceae bacterium]|nr:polyprenyl synthetase family protein [Pyrinomonadaceae bacterium]
MSELNAFLVEAANDVESELEQLLPRADVEPVRLHSAMRWSMFAGGKRFRPALVFAAGEVFGAERSHLRSTAAAIEMIHTFSLIHDDLPAMDDDDLRRGKPTCHKQFDEATAILAGDALQAMAFGAIAEDETLGHDIRVRLIKGLAAASSTPKGMVAGQQLDLEAENSGDSNIDIENIHRLKTGALIEYAAIAGAVIGGATGGELIAIHQYSSNIGLLFQITDDIIDVEQPSEVLGKTAGKDVASNKATFVSQLGIEGARKHAADVEARAIAALDGISADVSLLTAICRSISTRVN